MARLIAPFIPLLVCSSSQAQSEIGGIIGTDDRVVVESLDPPWNAVGRVNIAGYRKRRHCTGTLIGPRMVLTAAHCLIKRGSGKAEPVGNIHFLAGARRGKYVAHARAECIRFLGKTSRGLVQADRDVAVIVTKKPVSIQFTSIAVRSFDADETSLIHAGHPQDRPFVLNADKDCRLQERVGDLWLTDCDTNSGASGGPIFIKVNNQLQLAAIMVGFVKGKYTVAVPAAVWQDFTRKRTCP